MIRTIYEPHVATALGDLVKNGATVFDVGANVGYLTKPLSRLVGPRGLVVAFEAHPGLIPQLRRDLATEAAFNVWVENFAVVEADRSVQFTTDEDNPQGGHLTAEEIDTGGSLKEISVTGKSIDNYCNEHDLSPDLIKIDIEGAEINALRGARDIISRKRPFFILEQHIKDGTSCLEFMEEYGYIAVDLKHWSTVSARTGIVSGTMSDVLFFHRESQVPSPYRSLTKADPIVARGLEESRFTDHCLVTGGRYLIEIDWEFDVDCQVSQFLYLEEVPLVRFDGHAQWIKVNYNSFVVSLPCYGRLRASVDVIQGHAEVRMNKLTVSEILPRLPVRQI